MLYLERKDITLKIAYCTALVFLPAITHPTFDTLVLVCHTSGITSSPHSFTYYSFRATSTGCLPSTAETAPSKLLDLPEYVIDTISAAAASAVPSR